MQGTVYINNGKWYYRVKLPGERTRKAYPLCAPGSTTAMDATRPKALAVQAAWRIWEQNTKRPPSISVTAKTVEFVCAAYCDHAKTYYRRKDGTPTSEPLSITLSLRPLRDMFGKLPVSALTHADMLSVREKIISWGTCSRTTVNFYMSRIRRMWIWALDAGHIDARCKAELTQVQALKPNRTQLREPKHVSIVAESDFDSVCRLAPDNFADMLRVHRLTGMRPEEICALQWQHIDTTKIPWVYRPPFHKNQWRNQVRAILIGPRARAILEHYREGFGGFPFGPNRILADGLANPTDKTQSAYVPKTATDGWHPVGYLEGVRTYCRRSKCTAWTPNQLRHSFATQVRREFGIFKASYLCGHANGSKITDEYSREAAVDEIIREGATVIERIG